MISKALAFLALTGLILGAGLCLCAEETSAIPDVSGASHDPVPSHEHAHRHAGGGEDENSKSHSHSSKDECGCSASIPDLLLDSELGGVRTDQILSLSPALAPETLLASSPETIDRPRDDSGPPRPNRLPLFLRIHKLSL